MSADGGNVARYYGMVLGEVSDNADPKGLGRVRAVVPGLLEPSAWALPLTMGGGAAQRGAFNVPDVGSTVAIWFIQGVPENPVYLCANWGVRDGATEVPEVAKQAVEEDKSSAHKVKVLETSRYLVAIDEREGSEILAFSDKLTGDIIQMNGHNRGVYIRATTGIVLETIGTVNVRCLEMHINDRLVKCTEASI